MEIILKYPSDKVPLWVEGSSKTYTIDLDSNKQFFYKKATDYLSDLDSILNADSVKISISRSNYLFFVHKGTIIYYKGYSPNGYCIFAVIGKDKKVTILQNEIIPKTYVTTLVKTLKSAGYNKKDIFYYTDSRDMKDLFVLNISNLIGIQDYNTNYQASIMTKVAEEFKTTYNPEPIAEVIVEGNNIPNL